MKEGKLAKTGLVPLALVMFFLVAFAFLWVCGFYPLTDTDIWWHLAAAREMVRTGGFLRTDPFCTSSLGTAWIDLHWGFQLIVYGVWKLGGQWGLVAFKSFLFASALLLSLVPALRHRTFLPALLVAVFAGYHMRHLVDMRPLVTTMLALAAIMVLGDALVRGRIRWAVWLLVPLQLFLVNTQGLFLLGLAAAGFIFLDLFWRREEEEGAVATSRRTALLVFFGMCAACLFNPWGPQALRLPLRLFARIIPGSGKVFSSDFSENIPLPVVWEEDPASAAPFAIFILAVLFSWQWRNFLRRPGRFLLLTAFLALALMASRNLPLFYLAGIYSFAANVRDREEDRLSSTPGTGGSFWLGYLETALPVAGLFALIGYGSLALHRAKTFEMPGSLVTPFRLPTGAAGWLREHPQPGNLFNDIRHGGYLEWELYPELRPLVDGRMVLRSEQFFRTLLGLYDHPEAFSAFADSAGITTVLLPIAEFERPLALAGRLFASPDWNCVFSDGATVLFVRQPSVPADTGREKSGHHEWVGQTQRNLANRFSANPRLEEIAYLYTANFLAAAAADSLIPVLLEGRTGEWAGVLSGVSYLRRGRPQDAERMLAATVARHPSSPEGLYWLAGACVAQGNREKAAYWLRRFEQAGGRADQIRRVPPGLYLSR